MPYIAPEVVTEAKRMDLLTYLRTYEPGQLVRVSGNTYCTREHDSLKISNGKWMWWSRGIGGRTALDYLIKVKELSFIEAVETIMGNCAVTAPVYETESRSYENQPLLLPQKSPTSNVVTQYLFGRGIDYEIINECLDKELIIESLPYHNVVFIGYDDKKEAKYAAYRATNNSRIMGDCTGSKKQYSFRLTNENSTEVHLFECAIDLLISMEKSHCYNPFVYLQNDNDVQKLVTNLFKSTTPKGSQSQDPFWDTSASMLLLALVFYLHYEAPEEEQNFAMVMEMLRAGSIEDEEDTRPSPLDELFAELEMTNPDHIALKYYRSYHSGSAKTLKSIQITLAARLEKFNLESLASLTSADELDLPSMGEKKVALFALIPDNDSSFNFLVSILYTQLFQQLFYAADHIHGGSLPIPVHFLMDEFANVSLPDDFDKILSVMRFRGVSVSIILQNLAQLKALFEKQWESIVGNCDEFLYLGGNEQSTHKYVSELLGKETIDTNTSKIISARTLWSLKVITSK